MKHASNNKKIERFSPWKRTARKEGQNFSISEIQLDNTDRGTTIRKGPFLCRWCCSAAM